MHYTMANADKIRTTRAAVSCACPLYLYGAAVHIHYTWYHSPIYAGQFRDW